MSNKNRNESDSKSSYEDNGVIKEKNDNIDNIIHQNERLFKENFQLQIEIKKLQDKICCNKSNFENNGLDISNNTSTNFFLFSQIKNFWETLAKENINDCFIDFFPFPDLLRQIINEIVQYVKNNIKCTIDNIINKFMIECNISKTNKQNLSFVSKMIRLIIKEFYFEIFETENNFTNFHKFFEKFLENQIFVKISSTIQRDFENDFDVNSLKNLFYNLQRIIFYIEFKENIELEIAQSNQFHLFHKKDYFSVEGYIKENKNCLILIDTPKTQNGFIAFSQLKPIVISYPKRSFPSQYNFNLQLEIDSNNVSNLLTRGKKKTKNKIVNRKHLETETSTIKNKKLLLTMRYINSRLGNGNNISNQNNISHNHSNPKKGYSKITNGPRNILIKETNSKRTNCKTPKNDILIKGITTNIVTKDKKSTQGLNLLQKSKHRSGLSLNFLRCEEDPSSKSTFSKFKEFIVNRMIKYKNNTNTSLTKNTKQKFQNMNGQTRRNKSKSFERKIRERNFTNENTNNYMSGVSHSPSNKTQYIINSPKSIN